MSLRGIIHNASALNLVYVKRCLALRQFCRNPRVLLPHLLWSCGKWDASWIFIARREWLMTLQLCGVSSVCWLSKQVEPKVNEEVLQQLQEMGFSRNK